MRCPQHSDRIATSACTVCGERSCPECAPEHPAIEGPVCDRCRRTLPTATVAAPRRPQRALWPVAVVLVSLPIVLAFLVLRRPAPPASPDPVVTMARTADLLRDTTRLLDARHAADGAWPPGLEDLVPSWLDAVPADPFAPSRPLRYGPAPGRAGALTLWSVGPDGIDHGGSLLDPVTLRGDVAVPLE